MALGAALRVLLGGGEHLSQTLSEDSVKHFEVLRVAMIKHLSDMWGPGFDSPAVCIVGSFLNPCHQLKEI